MNNSHLSHTHLQFTQVQQHKPKLQKSIPFQPTKKQTGRIKPVYNNDKIL